MLWVSLPLNVLFFQSISSTTFVTRTPSLKLLCNNLDCFISIRLIYPRLGKYSFSISQYMTQSIHFGNYFSLAWVEFEPTTIESRSDALTDWAIRPWVQLHSEPTLCSNSNFTVWSVPNFKNLTFLDFSISRYYSVHCQCNFLLELQRKWFMLI